MQKIEMSKYLSEISQFYNKLWEIQRMISLPSSLSLNGVRVVEEPELWTKVV